VSSLGGHNFAGPIMVETSQLQTLVAVARAQSFSKAAEELGVTQSAISQSIKNLENKVGVKLFKRSGKKVVLTSEGDKLHSLAQTFISQMEDTLDEIRFDKDSMSGKVRIGTLTGVGKSWLAPKMMEYSKDNPELTVSVTLGFQEDLIKEFENYRQDILILPEENLPTIGEKILLDEEVMTLVYPKEFDLKKSIKLDELCDLPAIFFGREDHLFQKWCREYFGETPKKLNPRYIINSHGNMLQAVLMGLGIAVIPKHVLSRWYYKDKVLTLGKKAEVSNGRFFLVYHKGSEELLRIRKTLDLLQSFKQPLNS
jgi:DNA-binding transcriptional LysR family regulator